MLNTIPPEILTRIGYHLLVPPATSSSSSIVASSPPLHLLLTCKAVHDTLSSEYNPYLYADVFRAVFDTAAAERRLGVYAGKPKKRGSGSDGKGKGKGKGRGKGKKGEEVTTSVAAAAAEEEEQGKPEIYAVNLAKELKHRVKALNKLRSAVEVGDVRGIREKELWVVYVMLLEHGEWSSRLPCDMLPSVR